MVNGPVDVPRTFRPIERLGGDAAGTTGEVASGDGQVVTLVPHVLVLDEYPALTVVGEGAPIEHEVGHEVVVVVHEDEHTLVLVVHEGGPDHIEGAAIIHARRVVDP